MANWPDDRVWDELRRRFGDDDLPSGPVTEKGMVEMRSLVHEPMSYGRLFLVGDAAHIISPMGGKGMNLALHDADVLARAVRTAVQEGDEGPLAAYSDTCLRRVWDQQEFSRWMTEMVHDSGDASEVGPFGGDWPGRVWSGFHLSFGGAHVRRDDGGPDLTYGRAIGGDRPECRARRVGRR